MFLTHLDTISCSYVHSQRPNTDAEERMVIECNCMPCPVVSSWSGSEDASHQHDAKIWGASQTPFRGKWSKCHVPRRPGQGRRTGKKLHATSWDASKSEKVHRPLVDPAYQSWIWYCIYDAALCSRIAESLADVLFGTYYNGLALARKQSWPISSFMIKSAKLQHWLSACHGACHACGDWHHSKLGLEQKGNKGHQRTIMSGNSRAVDDRQSMRGLTHPICTSVPHHSAASHTWILFFLLLRLECSGL